MKKRLYWIMMVFLLSAMACSPLSSALDSGEEEETEEATAEPTPTEVPPIALDGEAFEDNGPVVIRGDLTYTYPFFLAGTAQPVIILEDQTGFIDRDEDYLMPLASQTLAQITTDWHESPFSYSLALPRVPQGTLRDVDHDGVDETGVMVFAVAYWENTWGDPYLEARDLYGGGWSTAYASTRINEDDPDLEREIVGGAFVVFAPDAEQSFPSDFGDDNMLFTEDDPIMDLPAGWSVINMEVSPFEIIRDAEITLDLYEPEGIALDDYSDMDYLEAYENMFEMVSTEYAFTEFKNIDWSALDAEFRPRFEEANQRHDPELYAFAMRDFFWSIPDAHVNVSFNDALLNAFRTEVIGGIGLSLAQLSTGEVVVAFVAEGSPAQGEGIEVQAEIIAYNGQPIEQALEEVVPWESPYSTEHNLRLGQLTYLTRSPEGTNVEVTYQNPGDATPHTAVLRSEFELDSYFYTTDAFDPGIGPPVQFQILDNGYAYVQVFSFFDNSLLTIQLWEWLIQQLNENEIPGLIIDLRSNGGGSGWLAQEMAAYFFTEELELRQSAEYDEETGEFILDEDSISTFILPQPDLIYHGDVVAIIGPSCASACEFFAYYLTLDNRTTIVGHYPTAGAGGGVKDFEMPDDITVRYPIGRTLDMEGNILVEGQGVEPDILVPVTMESLFGPADELLQAAIDALK